MKAPTCVAVIVAGGKGLRLDPEHPKQYLPLAGKPVLLHTLERFYGSHLFDHAVVVLPAADVAAWPELCTQYGLDRDFFEAVAGGATRFDSVGAGLQALLQRYGDGQTCGNDLWVAVHDGVRPLVDTDFLKNCLDAAFQHGNAVPALPPVESFRYVEADPKTAATPNRPIDRHCLRSLQTPQCARLSHLTLAWRRAADRPEAERTDRFTDEATVLEFAGDRIHLCEGSPRNLKITRPADLQWAETLLTDTPSDGKTTGKPGKTGKTDPAAKPAASRTILGIDPGTMLMGYGLVEACGSRITYIDMGVLDLRREEDPLVKLNRIHAEVNRLIDRHHPDALSIEAPFYGKNPQSLIKLGRAQGVAIAAAMARGLKVFEYAPLRIKQSITGNGNASKEQVCQMVFRILNLNGDRPKHLDATDALGAAVCHALQNRFEDLAPAAAPPAGLKALRATGVGHKAGAGHKKKPSSWESFLNQHPDRVK
ncbi:crossover junction endodeoxyribonuclease RuvC [bacterium]|nr:crossover junction endodeoxyribonuclease RuvC [bacterium]